MQKRTFLAIFSFVVLPLFSVAQTFPQKNYPQHYFQWPVGAKISIAANFGELRPNHFHMGLDCRTDQKENVPVYAAADGYIAKVKIEPFGFGRCIYINHPNGYTTLYAHLNAFNPALEKYVTEQQYRLQQWAIFIDIPAGLFPVKKGDYIASSGNTGGSEGPHTHFEIRDTKSDKNLNPLLFGMPLADNIPPDIIRLAVYDRTKSTYDQTPKIYSLRKINGVYAPPGGIIIAPSDEVSFAITAYDRYTGSANPNGIYAAAVFDGEKEISEFMIDSISYDDTRYFNAHIDYRLRATGGPWLQHLSPLPGYNNTVYHTDAARGVLTVGDSTHAIKIIVADANGNESRLEFLLRPTTTMQTRTPIETTQKFIPNEINVFENDHLKFYLPENALYDTVNFVYNELQNSGATIYQIHNATIPVHTYYTIDIKATFPVSDTGRIVMKRFYVSKEDFKKASFANGWYSAAFREFGNFTLMVDSVPPVIEARGFYDGMNAAHLGRILFSISDNCKDIRRFTALLDGKWLRFTNDKGRNYIYVFDDHCPPGAHELKITAEDLAGNITQKIFHFTR